MKKKPNSRAGMVEAINRPLGFYVLALLIVESFLVAALGLGPSDFRGAVICLGVAMFLSVVAVVTILVAFRPENMALSEDSYQERFRISVGAHESVSVKSAVVESNQKLDGSP
ncbi:MAG: hypothetical protein WC565_09145 [Parcubacteria group bacterium]